MDLGSSDIDPGKRRRGFVVANRLEAATHRALQKVRKENDRDERGGDRDPGHPAFGRKIGTEPIRWARRGHRQALLPAEDMRVASRNLG